MNHKIPADLQRLSDRELLALEDQILLNNELRENRTFFTQSRLIIYFLAIVLFGLALIILSPVFHSLGLQNNPLSILLYVGCLMGSVFVASNLWERLGLHPRYWVRTALHYWPITLTMAIYIGYFLKR
jgi:hypothetical protein